MSNQQNHIDHRNCLQLLESRQEWHLQNELISIVIVKRAWILELLRQDRYLEEPPDCQDEVREPNFLFESPCLKKEVGYQYGRDGKID